MFLEVQAPAAEGGIGAEQKYLAVSLFLQNISDRRHLGEKGILRIHLIVSDINFQWKAGGVGENSGHRIRRAGIDIPSVQRRIRPGKILPADSKACQLRNNIGFKCSARFPVRKGCLHRFQVDIDEISFLLGKSQPDGLGINIVLLDEGRLVFLVYDPFTHFQAFPYIVSCHNPRCQGSQKAYTQKTDPDFFIFEQTQSQDVENHHGCCRQDRLYNIVSDHPVSGAGERGLELENDLINIQFSPGCQSPSGREPDKRYKEDEQPRRNIYETVQERVVIMPVTIHFNAFSSRRTPSCGRGSLFCRSSVLPRPLKVILFSRRTRRQVLYYFPFFSSFSSGSGLGRRP